MFIQIYMKPGGLVGGTCFGERWDDNSGVGNLNLTT